MPDTENVLQLSRLFGVSCDYLLRDEVDEQGAPVPAGQTASAAPGETHLNEKGWAHNATALSLAACAVGLLLALGGWILYQTIGPLIIGFIIQIISLTLFELAAPRMGERRGIARLNFYMAACWLVIPIPVWGLRQWLARFSVRPVPSLYWAVAALACYLLLGAAVTAVLLVLRRRRRAKA